VSGLHGFNGIEKRKFSSEGRKPPFNPRAAWGDLIEAGAGRRCSAVEGGRRAPLDGDVIRAFRRCPRWCRPCCGFAGGLAGESGFAVAGLAGALPGNLPCKARGAVPPCGEEARGTGRLRKCRQPPRSKKDEMPKGEKSWGARREFSLLTRNPHLLTACWAEARGGSHPWLP